MIVGSITPGSLAAALVGARGTAVDATSIAWRASRWASKSVRSGAMACRVECAGCLAHPGDFWGKEPAGDRRRLRLLHAITWTPSFSSASFPSQTPHPRPAMPGILPPYGYGRGGRVS
eukprot:scaffold211355_cov27-Tisochrysis_lutea.AAC.2